MQLAPFVGELNSWSKAVQASDLKAADRHLSQLYHLGASLVASKELQKIAMDEWHHPIDQQVIESLRQFLALVQTAIVLERQSTQAIAPPLNSPAAGAQHQISA